MRGKWRFSAPGKISTSIQPILKSNAFRWTRVQLPPADAGGFHQKHFPDSFRSLLRNASPVANTGEAALRTPMTRWTRYAFNMDPGLSAGGGKFSFFVVVIWARPAGPALGLYAHPARGGL